MSRPGGRFPPPVGVEAEKGTGKMKRQQELIDGFLSRDPVAEARFVEELQKFLRIEVRSNYPAQWSELSDLQQSALLKVCEMRENPRAAELITPPFQDLAKRLAELPARKEKRVKHWPSLKPSQEPPVASNQEEAVTLKEMAEIAASLPRGMAKTMLAQEAFVAGDGPALEEALGTDKRSARRRLARAQEAVILIATGEDVEVEDE